VEKGYYFGNISSNNYKINILYYLILEKMLIAVNNLKIISSFELKFGNIIL